MLAQANHADNRKPLRKRLQQRAFSGFSLKTAGVRVATSTEQNVLPHSQNM